MIERIPKKGLALLLVSSLGAAGFAGYEIGQRYSISHPAAKILGERVLSDNVYKGKGVELLVGGKYGTPEHTVPFLTHYIINCDEPYFPKVKVHNPNPVVHSETVVGNRYSLESFADKAPIDNGQLCEDGTNLSADGVAIDTAEVLSKFDHQFPTYFNHENPGTYEGSAKRLNLTKKSVESFRKGISDDMRTGFGAFLFNNHY